jgi:hypothetical protein
MGKGPLIAIIVVIILLAVFLGVYFGKVACPTFGNNCSTSDSTTPGTTSPGTSGTTSPGTSGTTSPGTSGTTSPGTSGSTSPGTSGSRTSTGISGSRAGGPTIYTPSSSVSLAFCDTPATTGNWMDPDCNMIGCTNAVAGQYYTGPGTTWTNCPVANCTNATSVQRYTGVGTTSTNCPVANLPGCDQYASWSTSNPGNCNNGYVGNVTQTLVWTFGGAPACDPNYLPYAIGTTRVIATCSASANCTASAGQSARGSGCRCVHDQDCASDSCSHLMCD